jgi:hypothetical protein
MSTPDPLVVAQQLIPVMMPVYTCSLTPYVDALRLAREAIDDLRAIDPKPISSNVQSVYVSPWDSNRRTPKLGPVCEIVRTVALHVTKVFLSADLNALGMDYFVKDCWGMIYEKSDHTLLHNHFPAELSCALYLEADPGCAPIVFDNGFQIQPENGLLVLFPGILNHQVPATPGRRVVISMNLFKMAKGV